MEAVKLKGMKGGIRVVIDEEASWEKVIDELREKLGSSFFNEGKIFIDLGRRKLTREDYKLVDELLSRKPFLKLIGVEAFDPSTRAVVRDFLPQVLPQVPSRNSLFHFGTLRSGVSLEHEGDLVIIGDVNPGAEVYVGGNLAVFGALRGSAYVGINSGDEVFVVALKLSPSILVIKNKVVSLPSSLSGDRPFMVTFSRDKVDFHPIRGG